MTTPSSSGTSPSPALSFSTPATTSEKSVDDPIDAELVEREERRRKILARTEFAKLTRALRTTLAFASYKARHNVVDVPLSTLEQQVVQNSRSSNYPPGAGSPVHHLTSGADKKRKANSSINAPLYSSPLAQGVSHHAASASLGGIASSSAPQASHEHAGPGQAASSKSLFASILAVPPTKRARTIHNPEAPPVPPPPLPSQSRHGGRKAPKKGVKKGKETASRSRIAPVDKEQMGKERATKSPVGRERKGSASSTRSRSSLSGETEIVNDSDIKAAATLTDLLFSRSGGAASPRSSFSAPTSASRIGPTSSGVGAVPLSQSSSASSISTASQAKTHTRTASSASAGSVAMFEREVYVHVPDVHIEARGSITPTSTPVQAPRQTVSATGGAGLSSQGSDASNPPQIEVSCAVDSEAADLMLLLANSPRPGAPRDQDISRSAYAAGRVLFPGSPGKSGKTEPTAGSSSARAQVRAPMAAVTASTVASQDATDKSKHREIRGLGSPPTTPPRSQGYGHVPRQPSELALAPPVPIETRPPSSSARNLAPPLPLGRKLPSPSRSPRASSQTPVSGFNMHDYINITPSPAAVPTSLQQQGSIPLSAAAAPPMQPSPYAIPQGSVPVPSGTPSRYRSAVSVSSPLRKSFDRESLEIGAGGRKLFDDEPGREASTGTGNELGGVDGGSAGRKMRYGEGVDGTSGSLSSGIDLVQT